MRENWKTLREQQKIIDHVECRLHKIQKKREEKEGKEEVEDKRMREESDDIFRRQSI